MKRLILSSVDEKTAIDSIDNGEQCYTLLDKELSRIKYNGQYPYGEWFYGFLRVKYPSVFYVMK